MAHFKADLRPQQALQDCIKTSESIQAALADAASINFSIDLEAHTTASLQLLREVHTHVTSIITVHYAASECENRVGDSADV